MAMRVTQFPESELGKLLLGNIEDFVKEVDSHTPPLSGEQSNKLSSLLEKLFSVSKIYFSKRQQMKLVEAIRYATQKHEGVYRNDRVTPYLYHTLEVACLLIDVEVFDYKVLISAIIHDVVEDTDAKIKEIQEKFGYAISRIVELLTKHPNFIRRIGYWWLMKNENNLSIRWRVLVIKFADRIHNLMTLDCMPEKNRIRKMRETLEEFPNLYATLIKTLIQLRKKGILQKDRYMELPYKLTTRLVHEMSRYQ